MMKTIQQQQQKKTLGDFLQTCQLLGSLDFRKLRTVVSLV